MNRRHILIAIGVLAVIILAASGWYILRTPESTEDAIVTTPTPTQQSTPASSTVLPTNTTPTSTPTPTPSAEVKSFTITAKNYSFSPATITVKKGDTVSLTVKNSGGTHDLVIDEFNVETKLLADGESQTVQFVANKSGSYEFYCSFSDHRAMGMVGTLVVQ